MKRMLHVSVAENNPVARTTGNPSTETIAKIRQVFGLTACGNPIDKVDHVVAKDGTCYIIRPSEGLDMRISVRWDGDARVHDTCYAVYRKRKGDRFFTQITRDFGYFGVAQRHMYKLADVQPVKNK